MQIKNPVYNSQGTIDCEIEHPVYGWIPFTASPDDVELHGREIYQSIIDQQLEILPYVAPVIDEEATLAYWRNTTEVSRFQAYAALFQAGYYDDINAYMDSTADPVQKMAWNTAQVFKRLSPTVLTLQPLLGLSDTELDDLFRFALTIEAQCTERFNLPVHLKEILQGREL